MRQDITWFKGFSICREEYQATVAFEGNGQLLLSRKKDRCHCCRERGADVTVVEEEGTAVIAEQEEGTAVSAIQEEGTTVRAIQEEGTAVVAEQEEGQLWLRHRKKDSCFFCAGGGDASSHSRIQTSWCDMSTAVAPEKGEQLLACLCSKFLRTRWQQRRN